MVVEQDRNHRNEKETNRQLTDEGPSPYARAVEWVAKITTVGLEMALPAVLGQYLDNRLDTAYLTPLGLVIGFTAGMLHLLSMTGALSKTKQEQKAGEPATSGDSQRKHSTQNEPHQKSRQEDGQSRQEDGGP